MWMKKIVFAAVIIGILGYLTMGCSKNNEEGKNDNKPISYDDQMIYQPREVSPAFHEDTSFNHLEYLKRLYFIGWIKNASDAFSCGYQGYLSLRLDGFNNKNVP